MKVPKPAEGADGGFTYRIEVAEHATQRLDRFLAEQLTLSRSYVTSLIEAGHVLIADSVPKKSYVPESGDVIVVQLPPPREAAAAAEDIPIDILYEDEWLLVINKPAGLVVHPGPGHYTGTLVNALLHHAERLSGIGGVLRPGIVHRLDKDTSGLMIVAKEDTAHRRLSAALSSREVRRIYTAACWGHLDGRELRIEADIARHPRDRRRMAVVAGTRPATTEVECLEVWKAAEYLRVSLLTGRTHQIRVHLRHIGHPIAGDTTYGPGWEKGFGGETGRWAAEFAKRLPRQFLHASELVFEHPIEGREMSYSLELPEDLAAAVRWARATS